jgi:nicotinate dehydrogenase subunit B
MTDASADWGKYPILTFTDAPEIEIVLLDRPDQPALGAGEPSTVTTAPAVANAIFDATGVRLHRMPFTPETVGLTRSGLPQRRSGRSPTRPPPVR